MRTDTQKLEALRAVLRRHFVRLGRMTGAVMIDGDEVATEKALIEQDVAAALDERVSDLQVA